MKMTILTLFLLTLISACSRPQTPPPTTPVDAPTVEVTKITNEDKLH